jgi:NTE family protein
MGKKALVVSGGGSKGAFAVGVIKFLAENHPEIDFDIYVGTSTGSSIVPLAACGQLGLLEQLYTTVKTPDIVTAGDMVEQFAFGVSFYNTQPLANLIKKFINDDNCNAIFNSNKEVFIVTTCLQTAETVVWSTKPPPAPTEYKIKQVHEPKMLRRAVLASANQPVFMEPISIEDNPQEQYVDGGVREYLGIQLAIDAGADEIFAISLAAPDKPLQNIVFKKVFPILERTIEIFSEDVSWNDIKIPRIYNTSLRYIAAVKQKMKDAGISQTDIDSFFNIPLYETLTGKKPIKIHHIFPDTPLGGGPGGLVFDPQQMKGMLQIGENKMQAYLAALPANPDGNV